MNQPSDRSLSLDAEGAARRLGISKQTLYAYVSRGLIRSEPGPGGRERRYRSEDVERLRALRASRRDPARAVRGSLDWGMPVLDSALTLIRDGRIFYRGLDVLELARSRRLEEVAALLWTGDLDATAELFDPSNVTRTPPLRRQPLISLPATFQAVLPAAGAADLAALDLTPLAAARTGARIVRLLSAVTAGRHRQERPVAELLSRAWTGGTGVTPLIDQALVLCADHELNVSAFTVRCVASAGASPYAAVIAGLSALQGTRHGLTVERVERLLRQALVAGPRAAVADLLGRGEEIPGFGHPLYPEGDPRGSALLEAAVASAPRHPAVTAACRLVDEMERMLRRRPTLDFGLAVLAAGLDLPAGSALGLFAIGRTVGWMGHAIEEYAAGRLIRPRARYTGPPPG